MTRVEAQPFSAAEIVNLAPNVAKIFGAKNGQTAVSTIGHLVKNFDFAQVDVKDKSSQDFLHTGLAPSFGKLDKESMKSMDDELKIIIAAANRQLEKLPPDQILQRTWENILSIFLQNPLLEPMDTSFSNVDRADKLIKHERNFFHVEREHNDGVAREVLAWFTKLIGDEDVIKSIKFDIKVLADIVATTGTAIDSFLTFFVKFEHHEKTVVDIGVLRYPDVENPYFKVYRIQLTAWSDCRRIVFRGKDANGITGEYNMRRFKPRSSHIEGLKAATKEKAIAEAEDLFA